MSDFAFGCENALFKDARNIVEMRESTPSAKHGLSWKTEEQLRFLGSFLIGDAGSLLKMPQAGILTAQILYQQFWCQQSFVKSSYLRMDDSENAEDAELMPQALLDVAMACTLTAGKVEECHRRVRDVVNVYYHLYTILRDLPSSPMDYVCEVG